MKPAARPAPRIAFAGDRDIAVRVLRFLLGAGVRPAALLLPDGARASHAEALRELCGYLPAERIIEGDRFRTEQGRRVLDGLALDWIVGIHFPLLVPRSVLEIPRHGVLNLHPAFLPWNRGWHTPSWAILEGTPAGATLHFMGEAVDSGDIVHQRELAVSPGDTAHTLYRRIKALEYEVFVDAWPAIAAGIPPRTPQRGEGSAHRRGELLADDVRRIDPDASVRTSDLLRKLRALTTDRFDEAAFFDDDGVRYRIRVEIDPVPIPPPPSTRVSG